MKKLALTSICALAVSSLALAQGTVAWNSISTTAMSVETNSTQYSPLFGGGAVGSGAVGKAYEPGQPGTGFYYELLYTSYSGSQATVGSLASLLSWSDAGLGATNSSTSFLAGNLLPMAGNASAVVPWAAGVTNSILLVGWSANLGTSWASVAAELQNGSYISTLAGQNGFLGISATGYITPIAAGPNAGSTVFNTSPTAQGLPINSPNTQLYLLPVPEPATMALAGLGGLGLLLFRRRKS